MTPFFSQKKLTELDEQRGKLVRQYLDLVLRFRARSYRSERGKEYALHGFSRRLEILRAAIDQVFLALPPDLEEIPDQTEILTATIAIQAFVLNVDNLAWVWVFEKGVTATDGAELDPKMVGLWKRGVQDSMSVKFRKYVNDRKPWFESINGFRDSLAHRIPLYIPPHGVKKSNLEEHSRLEHEASATLARGDSAAYDRARDQQKKRGEFRPCITHSFYEKSGVVFFHFQLLSDWLTVEEAALKLLNELDGSSSRCGTEMAQK
jgi:hypothetical protein